MQQIHNEQGQLVDGLTNTKEVAYWRGETYSHYMERQLSVLEEKQERVTKLRDKKQYRAADKIAENLIRKGLKSKAVYLTPSEYYKALKESHEFMKKEIFGYTVVTDAQLAEEEEAGEDPEQTELVEAEEAEE